jgi:CheY-like chemotaxis protein
MTRLRILVVEDDPGHALLVERALRRGGVRNEILHFVEGGEVLEHLARAGSAGALVLLDLHLPRLDGFDVLRRLAADPGLRDTPVVVLTTTGDAEDLRVCRELGCGHYLLKPIDFLRFSFIVHELGLSPGLELASEAWPRDIRPA